MLTAEQLYEIIARKKNAGIGQGGQPEDRAAEKLYSLWDHYRKKNNPGIDELEFAYALNQMMEKAERVIDGGSNKELFLTVLKSEVNGFRATYENLPESIRKQGQVKEASDAISAVKEKEQTAYDRDMTELMESLVMVNNTLQELQSETHPAYVKLKAEREAGLSDDEYQDRLSDLTAMEQANRENLKATVATILAMDNLRRSGDLKAAADPEKLEAAADKLLTRQNSAAVNYICTYLQNYGKNAGEVKQAFSKAGRGELADLVIPAVENVDRRLQAEAEAMAREAVEKETAEKNAPQPVVEEKNAPQQPQPTQTQKKAAAQQPQPVPQQNTANVRKVRRTDDEEIDLYPHEVLTYGDADEASIQRYEKMFAARAETAVRAKDILNQTVRIGDTPTENERLNFENDMAYLFAMDEYRRQNKLSKAFNETDDLRSLSFRVREGERMKVLMASTQLKAGGDTSLEKMVRGMVYQGAHQDVVADGIAAASARLNEAKKEEFTRQFEELAQNAMQAKQNLDQLRKGTHEKQQGGELTTEALAELTEDYTRDLREKLVKLITMDNFRRRGTAYLAVEKPKLLQSEADELNRSRKMNSVIHSLVPKSGEGKTLETVFKELRKGTLRNVFAAGGKLVDNTAKPEKKVVTDPKKAGEPEIEEIKETAPQVDQPEQNVKEPVTEEPVIEEPVIEEPEPEESEASIFDRVEREFEEPLKAEPGRTSAPLGASGFGLENEPEEKVEEKVEEKAEEKVEEKTEEKVEEKVPEKAEEVSPEQAKEPVATEPVKQSVQAQPKGPAKTEFHPDSPIMRFQAKLEELREDIKESKISPLYYLEKEHCREGIALLFTLRDMGKKDPWTPVTKQQVIAHADEIYGDKGKENPEYKMYQDIDNAIRHGVTSMFENVVNSITGRENNADFVSKVHDTSRVDEWNVKWEQIQKQQKKMNGPVR